MISEEKIKQVFNAIKETNINNYDNESLAKLLSIFNSDELDEFIKKSYNELGFMATKRIMNVIPKINIIVNENIHKLKNTELFKLYTESLNNGMYREFIKSLSIEELAELKKHIYYTVNSNDINNLNGSKKMIEWIVKEIKDKEKLKKPIFENMVA